MNMVKYSRDNFLSDEGIDNTVEIFDPKAAQRPTSVPRLILLILADRLTDLVHAPCV